MKHQDPARDRRFESNEYDGAEEERLRLVQANEAIRLRDEFLSIASHELKTPLTALHLQLQTLRAKLGGDDLAARRKLEQALQSAGRLSALVEALLDVSRISTGRLSLIQQRFDLVPSAREVIDHFSDSARMAGCEIALQSEGPVVGNWDKLRVEQVLSNLLSNAIKYGPRCPIDVAVWQTEHAAVLEVVDGGPGIPKQDLTRIFERFERAHSIRQYGGLGLGLYVADQIARAHGGSVAARNVSGGGACFTVTLPLDPPARSSVLPK